MKNIELLNYFICILVIMLFSIIYYFLLFIGMKTKIVVKGSQIQNYVDTLLVRKYCWLTFWIMYIV